MALKKDSQQPEKEKLPNYSGIPVRIAVVIGKMVGGGVEQTVMNYYKHIDRSKIQYDFFVDKDSTLVPKKEIENLGGRIIWIPPYQKYITYHKALYRAFKENSYPLVYSHINTLSVFPLFAAWRANVPIRIAHNHSTAGKDETLKNIIKYNLRPFSKLFPTALCACSEYAGAWLFGKKAVSRGNVKIWNNSVEIDQFIYREEKRIETRNKLGLKQNQFVVGHVGRFIHQKNHMFLLDIFAQIHQRRPDSVLLLIGTGKLMDSVKNKAHLMLPDDSIRFLGNRTDVADLYQAMDLFLFPSFFEGLGMVAIEAQIAGLPVLASVPSQKKRK